MSAFVHPTAIVEGDVDLGDGTSVWHHAHVRSGATIGPGCTLGKNVFVDRDVHIGAGVKLQNNVSVYAGVTLDDHVFVGPSAVFTNDRYPRAHVSEWTIVPTHVERGASIGANATIVCGVVVGTHALVGAGAVVQRDVAAHRLVVGNPARPIGWVCTCGHPMAGGPDDDVDEVPPPASVCSSCAQPWQREIGGPAATR